MHAQRPCVNRDLDLALVKKQDNSSVPKKNPTPKFGLKSSSKDIYEWLFSIHRYIFN